MSFYRMFAAAIAAMSLAGAVLADQNNAADTSATQNTTMEQTANATDASQSMSQEKVNINKATAKELAAVKGMNMPKAKAIVSYRKKHGDFKSLDELKEVRGFKKMNEKTMKDIQDQLTLG